MFLMVMEYDRLMILHLFILFFGHGSIIMLMITSKCIDLKNQKPSVLVKII